MSLLSDIKFFVRKFLKNPAIVTAVAVTIYVILSKYIKKESFAESVKVVKQQNGKMVIYDDKLKKYILVDHDKGIYSDDKPDKLLRML